MVKLQKNGGMKMEETFEFLKIRTQVNYLSTINEGNQVVDHLEIQYYLMEKYMY